MQEHQIVAILQGLPLLITTCTLNELVYTRYDDGWYQEDEFVCEAC